MQTMKQGNSLASLDKNERNQAIEDHKPWIDAAKSIGILYDATSEQQIKIIKPFVSYFFDLKKDVKALGYVNAKILSYCHMPKLQYPYDYYDYRTI